MHLVKPALAGSVALVLFLAGCREGRAPGHDEALDVECRYTLRRPEGQQVRVWDGRFLEERIPCVGASRCLVGSRDVRVWRPEPGALHIEVGERVETRRSPPRMASELTAHNRLDNALVDSSGVLLVHDDHLELIDEKRSLRLARPAIRHSEAFAGGAVLDGRIAVFLAEHGTEGGPIRPVLWLDEAGGAARAAKAGLLRREGAVVGEAEVSEREVRVTLRAGWSTALPWRSARRPAVWSDGDLVVVWGRSALAAVGRDGRRFHRDLQPDDVVAVSRDGAWRFSLAGGIERISAGGLEELIPRRPHHDLGGAPLPRGAAVERLQVAAEDGGRLAVIERIRTPGCRAADHLYVVDVNRRTVTTLARDDRVRLHPTFARGKLHFTEADAAYEVVGGL